MKINNRAAQPGDPIIELIERFNRGLDTWERLEPKPHGKAEDEIHNDLVFQHLSKIAHETPKITTLAGVKAILNLIKEDRERFFEEGIERDLVLAIASYFDDEPAAADPDPVHREIKSFLSVKEVVNGPNDLTSEESKPIYRLYDERLKALGEFRPTTPEGERRLLEVLFVKDSENQLEASAPFFRALMGYANRHLGLDLKWPEDVMIEVSMSLDVRHGQAAS
jgi:hypothetical protein